MVSSATEPLAVEEERKRRRNWNTNRDVLKNLCPEFSFTSAGFQHVERTEAQHTSRRRGPRTFWDVSKDVNIKWSNNESEDAQILSIIPPIWLIFSPLINDRSLKAGLERNLKSDLTVCSERITAVLSDFSPESWLHKSQEWHFLFPSVWKRHKWCKRWIFKNTTSQWQRDRVP